LSAVTLSGKIKYFHTNTAQLSTMAEAAFKCAQMNAADSVAQHCMEIARG